MLFVRTNSTNNEIELSFISLPGISPNGAAPTCLGSPSRYITMRRSTADMHEDTILVLIDGSGNNGA